MKGIIRGRVLHEGAPVKEFAVALSRTGEPVGGNSVRVTDDNGRFDISADPGVLSLSIWHPGGKRNIVNDIYLATGGDVDLGDLITARGSRIHGRVVDLDGRPVARAVVRTGLLVDSVYEDEWTSALLSSFQTITNLDGEYELLGVDLWIGHERNSPIQAKAPNQHSIIGKLCEDQSVVNMVLLPIGRIEGTILSRRAGPIIVEARGADEPGGIRLTATSSNGTFEFDVPIGKYTVSVVEPRNQESRATVDVKANEMSGVELSITGRSVSVIVIIVGATLENAVVTMRPRDHLSEILYTKSIINDCGVLCYGFGDVSPGEYIVSAGTLEQTVRVEDAPATQHVYLRVCE